MKITPMPSPNGTNHERMFIFHWPKGRDVRGALDAAMRRKGARDVESALDAGKLRKVMDALIQHYVPEDLQMDAMSELDHHLGKRYGDDEGEEEENVNIEVEEGEAEDDHERDLIDLPRNAHEGGMGGRAGMVSTADRRRTDDRRRRGSAMDSALYDRCERMFGFERIKTTG